CTACVLCFMFASFIKFFLDRLQDGDDYGNPVEILHKTSYVFNSAECAVFVSVVAISITTASGRLGGRNQEGQS
ncbi:MAG: hypothetical protein IJU37_10650, partial [Desulfovibrio sp.]|nr:hypothetical protein [Desulfovibrio sp.]